MWPLALTNGKNKDKRQRKRTKKEKQTKKIPMSTDITIAHKVNHLSSFNVLRIPFTNVFFVLFYALLKLSFD